MWVDRMARLQPTCCLGVLGNGLSLCVTDRRDRMCQEYRKSTSEYVGRGDRTGGSDHTRLQEEDRFVRIKSDFRKAPACGRGVAWFREWVRRHTLRCNGLCVFCLAVRRRSSAVICLTAQRYTYPLHSFEYFVVPFFRQASCVCSWSLAQARRLAEQCAWLIV